jgi:hypothetical protein
MVLGPGDPNTWYFGTDKLYRSTDRADTAQVASQLLDQTVAGTPPLGERVSAIAISPEDDNVRIVGLNNGKIFATTIGSPTLLQIAGPGATNGPTTTPATANTTSGATIGVGRIAIDPHNKNVAYFAFTGYGTPAEPISHVYKTTNLNVLGDPIPGMAVFTALSSGLPDLPHNALAIDPQSGAAGTPATDIYVGTDKGVYNSRDGGVTWNVYGTGFPHVSVFGLEIQDQARVIRAATHGRGMYETFVALTPDVQLSKAASRLTHGAAGTFDINLPLAGTPGVENRQGTSGGGNYTIVLTFTSPVVSGSASITNGAGNVSNATFNGFDMIVSLAGVTDVQTVTLGLSNITDTNANVLSSANLNIGFLRGDTNASRTVSATDISQTKSRSGHLVEAGNFRSDVTASGSINSSDVSVVKSKSGNFLP